jgi:hypothetical protein
MRRRKASTRSWPWRMRHAKMHRDRSRSRSATTCLYLPHVQPRHSRGGQARSLVLAVVTGGAPGGPAATATAQQLPRQGAVAMAVGAAAAFFWGFLRASHLRQGPHRW